MENLIFSIVFALATFCALCCLIYEPKATHTATTTRASETTPATTLTTVESDELRMQNLASTAYALAQADEKSITLEPNASPTVSQEIIATARSSPKEQPFAAIDSSRNSRNRPPVTATKEPQSQIAPQLLQTEPETISQPQTTNSAESDSSTVANIDIDKLPITVARKIASRLSKSHPELRISQKVNGKDKPVSQLRAEIKNRLVKAPEIVNPILLELAPSVRKSTRTNSSSNCAKDALSVLNSSSQVIAS